MNGLFFIINQVSFDCFVGNCSLNVMKGNNAIHFYFLGTYHDNTF